MVFFFSIKEAKALILLRRRPAPSNKQNRSIMSCPQNVLGQLRRPGNLWRPQNGTTLCKKEETDKRPGLPRRGTTLLASFSGKRRKWLEN
jgi:hypothetical protein